MSSHSDSFSTSGNSPTQPDFVVENHGSIFLLRSLTPSATEWVEEHIGEDNGYQGLWPTVIIEPRYIMPIIEGILESGLVIR